MTLSLWLRIYGASVIGIMLLVRLGFPLGPLRQWLQSGPYVGIGEESGTYAVVDGGRPIAAPSKWAARVKLGPINLLRSWLGDLVSCYWCAGAWVTLVFTLAFALGTTWDRLTWWGPCWLSASFTCAVIARIEDT